MCWFFIFFFCFIFFPYFYSFLGKTAQLGTARKPMQWEWRMELCLRGEYLIWVLLKHYSLLLSLFILMKHGFLAGNAGVLILLLTVIVVVFIVAFCCLNWGKKALPIWERWKCRVIGYPGYWLCLRVSCCHVMYIHRVCTWFVCVQHEMSCNLSNSWPTCVYHYWRAALPSYSDSGQELPRACIHAGNGSRRCQ